MSAFTASDLPPYTVIRVPEALGNPEPKRFVVIGNEQAATICMKTTSQTTPYKNSREMMESCVFYKQGSQLQCFSVETAVQPNNLAAYTHAQLNRWYNDGTLQVFGCLPGDEFERELRRAVDGCVIHETTKKKIIGHIEANARNRNAASKKS